jgi:hypothetical protein
MVKKTKSMKRNNNKQKTIANVIDINPTTIIITFSWWYWSFMLVRQVLYHLSHFTSPSIISLNINDQQVLVKKQA